MDASLFAVIFLNSLFGIWGCINPGRGQFRVELFYKPLQFSVFFLGGSREGQKYGKKNPEFTSGFLSAVFLAAFEHADAQIKV
ncbi:hypothetical protein OLMES_0332 [Oleiphilus messinensis]|uniref:Uncharacterized protein n=1 Tax=Oleiphilus messinensis TaxID=141451 RepID=A0A1Y0I1T6_9GAMM|nr:hypothetical protein OLMES_0332 [Oleiphilus messinensis]